MTETERYDAISACAEAAHELNKIYCVAHGDFSQVPWFMASDWQRGSAIKGVQGVLDGNTPAQSHEAWCQEKLAMGWVYGEIKDPKAKTHPCLVSYEKLDAVQRHKDVLYIGTVKLMAVALGLV